METVQFSIDKNSFQKASFKKYLSDLKENRDLQRGGLVVILFTSIVLLLGTLIDSLIFQYLSKFTGILFIILLILVGIGNFSTWKDGKRNFDTIFGEEKILIFSYNSRYFIYGDPMVNRRYFWSAVKRILIFQNLDMIILEDKDHAQFYIKLSNEQVEEFKLTTSHLNIPTKYIN